MDDDAPPGVPEWVVTYGDMMSLLLTFFIMLVSMSEVKANEKYRAIVESLTKYLGYPAAASSPAGENFPMNSLIERLQTLGSHLDDGKGRGGVRHQSLDGDDMRVFRNREGRQIAIGTILFERGSSDLSPASLAALHQIAVQIAGKPNKIDVRGFAAEGTASPPVDASPGDRIPPNTRTSVAESFSTRQLAYRRSRVVLLALEDQGIRHDRLRLTAEAVLPRPDQSDSADRVDVFALDQFSEELVGPRGE